MSAPSSRANSDTAQVRGSKLTSSPPPFSHLFHFLRRCAQSLQFCPTSCDLMDCSLPNSSVHGIFQARIVEWVVRPSSRASSQHRDQTWVSCIAGGFFSPEPPGEPLSGGGNSSGHREEGGGFRPSSFLFRGPQKGTASFTGLWGRGCLSLVNRRSK